MRSCAGSKWQQSVTGLGLLALLLGPGLFLYGCSTAEPNLRDVIPPHTVAVPAGGVYRTLPARIRLLVEAGAVVYYRWQGQDERRYAGPIQVPEAATRHLILTFWAQDAAGNREAVNREHYLLDPAVPAVEILALDRPVLGASETAVLHWRSSALRATYELAVTSSGWGPGRRLAHGQVASDEERRTPIPGAALYPGENRLWLRVRDAAGTTAAVSRMLLVYATPATTRAWPAGGVFGTPQRVTLFTTRPATIYYTTDGSAPTIRSRQYTEPIRLSRSTVLRYFSIDPYGHREPLGQEQYDIRPQVPTVTLQALSTYEVHETAPVRFSWRSDTAGRYDITLLRRRDQRQITVQQGTVRRHTVVHSTVPGQFLTPPGDWRVRVRVQTDTEAQTGFLAFWLHVQYVERFGDTRYLDPEATTARWDTARQLVRLSRGPRLLGSYHTRGHSRRVSWRGRYAYLANGRGGLHIVDVAEPRHLRRIGMFYPHGKATALAKYEHFVYMAAGLSGLTILDVAQPAAPRLVATLPLGGHATEITIAGRYAYVGTRAGLLYVLDLSRPLRPRVLGSVNVGGQVVDSAVAEGMVYLACLDQGLVIVDARTPQQPRVVGRHATAEAATGVALYNQRLYVAAEALEVFDVRRPEAPVREAVRWLRGAYGVTVLPPYVVIAAGTNGVRLMPVDKFAELPGARTAHYAARLALAGSHLLVADTRGGLRVFDVTQAPQLRFEAGLDDIGTIVDVIVDGTVAYLADDRYGSGLVVVDISTPEAPLVLGRFHTEATTDVAVWQDLAVLGDASGALLVVDIQQPARPRLLGSLMLPGKVQRVVALPPYVLVASDTAGVHVVEVAPPRHPQLRATVPVAGRALDLVLVEKTAYIAAVSGGIQTVEVSAPLRPVSGPVYHHSDGEGDNLIRLAVAGHHLFAIDSERGLQVLRREAAGRLVLEGSRQVPQGAPWALTTVGPYVFVTTLLNTLYVIDAARPSQPRVISTAPSGGADVAAAGRYLYIAVRGGRGVPGGLRVVEAFAPVTPEARAQFEAHGIPVLAAEHSDTLMVNRAYTFNTPGVVQSTTLSWSDDAMQAVVLHVEDFWGRAGEIRYELSNDGGAQWHAVQPGQPFHFPTAGHDLRWRAVLTSADPTLSPQIDTLRIEAAPGGV
jgi:hypothetical protein